jgi:hypothetical protein
MPGPRGAALLFLVVDLYPLIRFSSGRRCVSPGGGNRKPLRPLRIHHAARIRMTARVAVGSLYPETHSTHLPPAGLGPLLREVSGPTFIGPVFAQPANINTIPPALLYVVLSLTVVRMLPVLLCLLGTRTSTADKLYRLVWSPWACDDRLCGPRARRKAARQRQGHTCGGMDGLA